MRPSGAALVATSLLISLWRVAAYQNYSKANLLQTDFSVLEDRPEGCPKCPSCFNCNSGLDTDKCTQYAKCNRNNGKCSCPPGFGGDDCSEPLCGSLALGKEREPRENDHMTCECQEGWTGINCNVCITDRACDALMPEKEGGVCFKQAVVVKENYQMCDVTNKKIIDQLGPDQKPQVTFSCKAEDEKCNFQCKTVSTAICRVWD